MKTIIMKDIIEKVATREQLCALHKALSPSQYYDLMMNTKVDVSENDDGKSAGVLGKDNVNSKTYKAALVEHLGMPKKFWENANALVVNINKDASVSDREDFHLVERTVSDELIHMLQKGVPGNDEALNEVIEEELEANSLLNILLLGILDRSCWINVKIMAGGNDIPAHVGLVTDDYLLRYQPKLSLLLHILREFKNAQVKTLRFDRVFLDLYAESPNYQGNLESELAKTNIQVAKSEGGKTVELCQSLFTNISTVRNVRHTDKPMTVPDEIEITINQDAWLTLTTQCRLID